MFKKRKSFEGTMLLVRKARRKANPNSSFQEQLRLWYQISFRLYWNEMLKVPCKEYEDYRLQLEAGQASKS